jgi:farnesyl-diphosphate farnesyltransferase
MLVDVSRSFALIIPMCPPPLDRCLCVGYLLCRLADTVEDEVALSTSERNELYDALLACIHSSQMPGDVPSKKLPARCNSSPPPLCGRGAGSGGQAKSFVARWNRIPDGGYGELIRGTDLVLHAFASLPGEYRPSLVRCADEMIAGMRSMHPLEARGRIHFYCRDLNDLDRYCHYVAGTVGIMSTALFERFLSKQGAFAATDEWREQGRRMGLGLPLTNIIKDAAADAQRGASYIPPGYLESGGGTPRLIPQKRAELIRHALDHLDRAILYTTALPASETGIRAFLLGSILPATATLELSASGRESPKVDRTAMTEILEFARTESGDNRSIRVRYAEMRARCEAALPRDR